MQQRKKLSDILNGSSADFKKTWDATEASDGFKPLPAGTYSCLVASGELSTSKSGTPGYKITFEILDGPFGGRKIWHDIWLTDKSMAIAKGELAKFGIVRTEQLDRPLPVGLLASVKVVLHTTDEGDTYNRIKSFEVKAISVPAAVFAPFDVPAWRTREPGDDDDLNDDGDGDAWDEIDKAADAGGFDWRNGNQSPTHANNGRGSA